jgi:hypothetical protein
MQRLAISACVLISSTALHCPPLNRAPSPEEWDALLESITDSEIEALEAELLQSPGAEPVSMTPEQLRATITELEHFLIRLSECPKQLPRDPFSN